MAEYIEREPLLEILNGLYNHHLTMGNYSADSATQDCIEAVIEAPASDVVPKSEVERIFESLEKDIFVHHFNTCLVRLIKYNELKKKYTEG